MLLPPGSKRNRSHSIVVAEGGGEAHGEPGEHIEQKPTRGSRQVNDSITGHMKEAASVPRRGGNLGTRLLSTRAPAGLP